jgi:hypothetical protein
MRTAQLPNPQKRQVSRSYPIPASTKGWVANEAITKMDPEAAVLLDNWFPDPDGIRWRRGSQIFATLNTETGPVETVMIWQGGSASKMFGCCGGKIYSDASAGGTITTTVATGLTNNRWQWLEFSTAGGQFLLACNGADAYRQYDGTTWTTTAVTGPAVPNALIQIWSFKQRIFFVEQNTADVWYAPVNTITGALTKLPLGSLLTKGGSIMAGATWTHDAGQGPQDYCVFVSTEGETLIYSGTDPSVAANWVQVGRFQIGRPIGRRCFLNIGSDLVVLCADGVMPMSQAIAYDRAAAAKASFTWNIQKAFQDAYGSYGTNFGWQIMSYAGNNMAIINVPVIAADTSYQFVMNVLTGAWCRYKGINASAWVVMRDALYFGGVTGKIWQGESGSADNSLPISASWISAYNDLGVSGRSKSVRMVRPVFVTDPAVLPAVGVCVDYDNTLPTITAAQTTSVTASSTARWDIATWDVSTWPATTNVVSDWQSAYGDGYQIAAAVTINISSSTPTSNLDCKLTVFNVLYEPGGII